MRPNFLLPLLLFTCFFSFSQNKRNLDSLYTKLPSTKGEERIKVLNAISSAIYRNDNGKAKALNTEAIEIAKKIILKRLL